MKNNNIQYVILVVYYEKYFDKAMYELDKMINSDLATLNRT